MERAKALRVNAGIEPNADLGPVISKHVRLRLVINKYGYKIFICFIFEK